ncbi:hypothetical protein MRB53_039691 [Persea americana]|nr:hypothetical protein MRB53_039691 [Persea americana]
MRNSATPFRLRSNQLQYPIFPYDICPRHQSRYLRARAGSMPDSLNCALLRVNKASHDGILAACCTMFLPMSLRNVSGSGTNGSGGGTCSFDSAARWTCRHWMRPLSPQRGAQAEE